MTAGYSGTPLAKKLGIKPGCRVMHFYPAEDYAALLAPLPADVEFVASASAADVVHLFTNSCDELLSSLAELRRSMRPAAALWVSWYKKASRLPTEVTEDVIRHAALPLGFVDVKVCAVDEKWSGLKLVIRKEFRI